MKQLSGVDLLFHEATFAESELHVPKRLIILTAAQAARIALEAGVRQLVIGHFSARYEDESILLKEASAGIPEYDSGKRKFVYKSLIPGK